MAMHEGAAERRAPRSGDRNADYQLGLGWVRLQALFPVTQLIQPCHPHSLFKPQNCQIARAKISIFGARIWSRFYQCRKASAKVSASCRALPARLTKRSSESITLRKRTGSKR